MTVRVFRILALAVLLFTLVVQVAGAASSASIHEDAADGAIEGTYTLAEMREADGAVSNEQREYYGWDDAYGEYMRQLAAARPSAERPAHSVLATGRRGESKSNQVTASRAGSDGSSVQDSGSTPAPSAARSESSTVGARASTITPSGGTALREPEDSRGLSLLWVFAAIPLLVIFAVLWRARRGWRGRRQQASHAD